MKIEEVMADLPPLEPSSAAVDLMLGVGRLQVLASAALSGTSLHVPRLVRALTNGWDVCLWCLVQSPTWMDHCDRYIPRTILPCVCASRMPPQKFTCIADRLKK